MVAGHRVTHSRPFRNIDTMGPGDEVIFHDRLGPAHLHVRPQRDRSPDGDAHRAADPGQDGDDHRVPPAGIGPVPFRRPPHIRGVGHGLTKVAADSSARTDAPEDDVSARCVAARSQSASDPRRLSRHRRAHDVLASAMGMVAAAVRGRLLPRPPACGTARRESLLAGLARRRRVAVPWDGLDGVPERTGLGRGHGDLRDVLRCRLRSRPREPVAMGGAPRRSRAG